MSRQNQLVIRPISGRSDPLLHCVHIETGTNFGRQRSNKAAVWMTNTQTDTLTVAHHLTLSEWSAVRGSVNLCSVNQAIIFAHVIQPGCSGIANDENSYTLHWLAGGRLKIMFSNETDFVFVSNLATL